jgi:hypothetical protein
LIKKGLKVLWKTVKFDGQWLIGRLEELGCCRIRKLRMSELAKAGAIAKGTA